MNLLALRDASGAVLLRLAEIGPHLSAGQSVAITGGPGVVSRTEFGFDLRPVPMVDNDGLHPPREKTGSVFLDAGMHPIRLEWFNGPAEGLLKLELEGPDLPRQQVPGPHLWHAPARGSPESDFQPGISYRAYERNRITGLADVWFMEPNTAGVATNFAAAYRTRDIDCALVFDGSIQISRPGLYKFYLTSDDGSRLYLGKPAVTCERIALQKPLARAPETLAQALADRSNLHWIETEGEVMFASENQRGLYLELLAGGNRVPVTVVEGAGLSSSNLLHRWVKVEGSCRFSGDPRQNRMIGVFVPGAGQVQVQAPEERLPQAAATNQLTLAVQVRRLSPAEAGKHAPARICGVVIFATPSAVVLRDSSGGIFTGCGTGVWERQPRVGESWEMEGTTDPGLFSPVLVAARAKFLGYAPLPEPVQPTRDQLMNGNLDAEYVELRGVVTSATKDEITLLTADGRVSVLGNEERPLPELPKATDDGGSIAGSVVRIRGCFATSVNVQTRQVAPAKVYIYPALVEVEDPAPNDPFLVPARAASDLMWFDARASALVRTRLAGQLLHAAPGEYFVYDGKTGFRVLVGNTLPLTAGDWIEAVGFPKLDGPSPVLLEAQVRKTGQAALPNPTRIAPEGLLDRRLDSTLVEVEAMLVSDTIHQGNRSLELQSGPRYFLARLDQDAQTRELLAPGCQLRVAGVYACAAENAASLAANSSPFELLINRGGDIVVLRRPPWWTLQRVFTVLLALSGALGVMFVWVALLRRKVEQRTEQLKSEIEQRQLVEQHHAVELERTRVARDLHDELGAGLTEVSMLGSLANSKATGPEARSGYLDQLTNVARSLVTSLDEIVWAVNPEYDTVNSVVSYFSLFAESFLSLAGIKYRLHVTETVPERPLDSKMRHGTFCAFKELLNNIVQHSGATEVQILFEVAEESLVISVIDDGRGFEIEPDLPGKDGLSGLRQRMQALGGECVIASQAGRGTKAVLRLPLNQPHHDQSSHR